MLRKNGTIWKLGKSCKALDKQEKRAYNGHNFIETVEAEITAMMPSQRACVAESQV
jgi:hypothetical protein